MALPKSPQEIFDYDPSEEFGGTYDPSKKVDVTYGFKDGGVYVSGGGTEFKDGVVSIAPPRGTTSGFWKNYERQQNLIEQQRIAAQRQAEIDAQRQIEEMRQAGIARQEQQARQQTQSERLVASIKAKEEVQALAEERGRPLTRIETQRELQRRGTSIGELREATRASRTHFKRTGVSVQEQLRIKKMRDAGIKRLQEQRADRFATLKRFPKQDTETLSDVGQVGTYASAIEGETATCFRIGLSEEEKLMPTREVISGRFKEVGVGAVKFGVGTTETLINLYSKMGIQKIEPGQRIGFLGVEDSRRFTIGGRLGEIATRPETTGTILGRGLFVAPLIGAGVTSFVVGVKTLDLTTAVKETLASLSPFKIRPGVYGTLESAKKIKDLKFDVVSIKKTTEGITTRDIVGTTGDKLGATVIAKQVSKQVAGKEIGVSAANIIAPRTTITPSGEVIQGVRALRTQSIFFSEAGKPALVTKGLKLSLQDLAGAGATVYSRTVLDLTIDPKAAQLIFKPLSKFEKSTIGGVTKKGELFDLFVSGGARRVLRIGREGGKELVKLEKIKVKGIEIEIGKVDTGITFERFSSPSLITKQVTPCPIISTPKQIITPSKILTTPPLALGLLSPIPSKVLIKPKEVPLTTTEQITKPITKTVTELITIPRIDISPLTKTRGRVGVALKPLVKQEQKVTPITVQKLESLTMQKTEQRILQELKQLQQQHLKTRETMVPFPSFVSKPPVKPPVKKPFTDLWMPWLPSLRIKKQPTQRFGVAIRRYGKFQPTITTKDLSSALRIGKYKTGVGLGATFRITGAKGRLPSYIPGYRRKVTPTGTLFIEKRGRRIKKRVTGSKEVRELMKAKALKKKKKKREEKKK